MSGTLVSLDEAAGRSVDQVGGKALNLARLRGAGFNVPDGYVITTGGFGPFVEANGFDVDTPADSVLATPLPPELVNELRDALERLGGSVAVRSSGVAEDLATASYAGQYESVLGVSDIAQAEAAVARCWSSAFGEHALHYHQAKGNRGVPAMAVLVQRMVPATAAGVAFSANPVTGDRQEVVVAAVPGLGDRLVAGEVNGEHWTVKAGTATRTEGSIRALSPEQALKVAQLAVDVERHFGSPQDIEWAIDGDEVHLLQARPITTLPEPQVAVAIEVPEGYWEREISHAPRPYSPLASTLIRDFANPALRQTMADFGLLVEALEFAQIGGWEYIRIVPLGGKDRPAPPAWLMPILIRAMPSMRRRIQESVEAMRADKAGALVDRWYEEWQPRLVNRSASLRSVDMPALTDDELASHWAAVLDHGRECVGVHFTLHAATCFHLAELALASTELLGWPEPKVWDLLAGLSRMSTEPARALGVLAQRAASRPETRRAVLEGGPAAIERLRQTDPDFASALAAYLDEHGMRALSYDPAISTLGEQPDLVLGLIADQITRGVDIAGGDDERSGTREAALAEARALLATKSEADQQRWERALTRAARAYPIREDNEYYTVSGPLALIRMVALEVGRRLLGHGQAGSETDVFWLRYDEVGPALLDGRSLTDLVATRRAQRAWIEAHPGPASYGKHPGPPPSLDALPAEARFANQAFIWYAERIFETERSGQQPTGDAIQGIAASPGRYRGPARVIRGEDEFVKIEAGDVLVCPITSPVWSVLFPSIGGLVTDTGGILSHPAIIAREYGVPAVVATGNATGRLQDGQLVEVDGTSGQVVPVS